MIKLPPSRSTFATTLYEKPEPNQKLLWLTSRTKQIKSYLLSRQGPKVVEYVLQNRGSLENSNLEVELQQYSGQLAAQGLQPLAVAKVFAIIDEALFRVFGFRYHDSQLLGGWNLTIGNLSEMATGEGKTLTACLPSALFAACGVPVHVISVNDYLTERDAQETGPVHALMGLSVGAITHDQGQEQKRLEYCRDIVYVTNKEVAFDYLRDRQSLESVSPRVAQLGWLNVPKPPLVNHLGVAIIDEADSVLVDEANIPLILTAPTEQSLSEVLLQQAIELDATLPDDAWETSDELNEGRIKQSLLQGFIKRIPDPDPAWRSLALAEEILNQARTARKRYVRDLNYMIIDSALVIIDENTGRPMPDRSLPWGLQQVLEVREGLTPSPDRSTLSKISYQQFFRKYHWLSGMSGTLKEVKSELRTVYALGTKAIPTHRPVKRYASEKRLFNNEAQKLKYTLDRARHVAGQGRAVLIAVSSVYLSEKIYQQLGLESGLINARTLEQEADTVSVAGQAGKITVVTNMAGRGTDIKLQSDCRSAGGLHVIIADCLESERLDRQLFGRAGRQGDPGSYDIFHSLDEKMVGLLLPDWWLPLIKLAKRTAPDTVNRLYFRVLKYRRARLEKLRSEQRIQLLRSERQRDDLLSFTRRS